MFIQNTLRIKPLDLFFTVFTTLGNAGLLWIAMSGVMLCFKKWGRVGGAALCAMLICFLLQEVLLKNLVARPRPFYVVEGLTALVPETGFSFPSGHTASSFAAATVYMRGAPRRFMKILAPILAVLMGFSRLYVGVHYPSDVLGGALIGIICGYFIWPFFNWCFDKIKRKVKSKRN